MRNIAGKKNIGRRDFIRTLAGTAVLAGITGPFDYLKAQISEGEKGIYITNIYRTQIKIGWGGWAGVIVRVETNKGIVGYGECRDLDDESEQWLDVFAPYLIGKNPTQVENIYTTMVQLWDGASNVYNQEREGTGAISGIEMACWDIIGKVYNVPVYKLLGPRLRDKIPMYADTDNNSYSAVVSRVEKGFKFFKCDMYLSQIAKGNYTTAATPNNYGYREITINSAGLEQMHNYMDTYRNTLQQFGEPYASAPIASDHYQGYNAQNQLSVESAIALANDLKEHNMGGWIEDIIDWWVDDCSGLPVKEVTDGTSSDVIICTGEDMFGFDQFKNFADKGAVRLFHPEPNTAGGINQTVLATKYAHEKGIKSIMHNSSGPIAMACYAHIAAVIPDFVALEYHQMNYTWHDDLIDGVEKPMIQDGYTFVPEGPGLGFTPNEAAFATYGAGTWTKII